MRYQTHLELWMKERDYQREYELSQPLIILEEGSSVSEEFFTLTIDQVLG